MSDLMDNMALLESLECGFRKAFSYSPKQFHKLLSERDLDDGSGDSTVLFVKDDLAASDQLINSWTAAQNPDGSWNDLAYDAKDLRSVFPPVEHLRRIRYIAKAECNQERNQCVDKALVFWLDKNFQSDNWWWNEIGVPLQLCAILLLSKDVLPAETFQRGLAALQIGKIGDSTGQNRVWLSFISLIRSILARDFAGADTARKTIIEELEIGRGGIGIQKDWSYQNHGRILQQGNYGLSFALSMSQIAFALKGTPWAFTDKQNEIVGNFISRGLAPVLWKDRMDVGAIGRQLNPDSARRKSIAVKAAAEYFELASDSKVNLSVPNGLSWFGESAYGVYRTGSWMASLKCETSSILGGEKANGDNHLGHRMASGALFVYSTGREYEDIFPLWNWQHVPGVTAHENEDDGWKSGNELDDLSTEGQSVRFSIRRNGLAAQMEYRFSDVGVEVRASGISSDKKERVVTTVEQNWACKNASWEKNGDRIIAVNGPFRYDLPANAIVQVQHRTGYWKRHMAEQSGKRVAGEVFEIVIPHGVGPHDASCSWIIAHNEKGADFPVQTNHCEAQPHPMPPRILFASHAQSKMNPFVNIIYDRLWRLGCDVDYVEDKFWSCVPTDYDILQLEWPEGLVCWKLADLTDEQLDSLEKRLAAFRAAGCKICYTRHNTIPHSVQNDLTVRLYRIVENAADAVFHMAEYSKKEFLSHAGN